MPKIIDITGQKFGRLTALRETGEREGGAKVWEFLCDCGSEVRSNAAYVRFGQKGSCGCLARELSSKRKRLNLLGIKFGRLTVIECKGPDKNGAVRWSCRCECGGTNIVAGSILKAGKTLSCGCIRKELMSALGASGKQENPYSRTSKYRSELRKMLRQNPSKAMAERLSRLMAHAMLGIGSLKSSPTFEMLGFTPGELRRHIERQFHDGMSWGNRNEWELDHILPISMANNVSDVIALNQLSNLRPLWKTKNNQKKAQRLNLI